MKKSNLSSNVWKLYIIRALRSFMLTIPIIVLFFQENGLTMKEIFLLQAFFSLAVIFLEVPTGYFSDIFGRKKSIIIGGILATLGFVIYYQSYSFWGFLLAEVVLGFGISFISGADSAMLYDTLLEISKEKEYKKTEGRGLSIGMFSEGVASIMGSLLAVVSLRFPIFWDAAVNFLIIPMAITLVEPKKHLAENTGSNLKNIFRLIKFSLFDQKEIKWLILYSATVGTSTLVMFWLTQPYLLANEIPLEMFGVILAFFLAISSFFSWNSNRFEKILGRKKLLILLIIFPSIGYFLLSSLWFVWSAIFISLFYVVRGLNNPVMLDYINGLIPSDIRATVLSVKNLVGRLMFSVVGPFVGWINDVFSLKVALIFSGVFFLVSGLIAIFFMHRHKFL